MKILAVDNNSIVDSPNCDILIKEFIKMGNEVVKHNPFDNYYEGEAGAFRTRHFQMYDFPIRRAIKEKVDILFFNEIFI